MTRSYPAQGCLPRRRFSFILHEGERDILLYIEPHAFELAKTQRRLQGAGPDGVLHFLLVSWFSYALPPLPCPVCSDWQVHGNQDTQGTIVKVLGIIPQWH